MIVVVHAGATHLIRVSGRVAAEAASQGRDGGRVIVVIDATYEVTARSVHVVGVSRQADLAEDPEVVGGGIHGLGHDVAAVWYYFTARRTLIDWWTPTFELTFTVDTSTTVLARIAVALIFVCAAERV